MAKRNTLPVDHPCEECEVSADAACNVLDEGELADFRRQGSILRLAAGQPLFHEGDAAEQVYSLAEGVVKLFKLLPDGRRQVTGFLFPGDFLGISVDGEHAFSAEAVTAAKLCRYSRTRFQRFADDHGHLEKALYRLAAHELVAAQDQMILLGRKTATERLASFLLMLHDRALRAGEDGRKVLVPMNRIDIADYLGLTKETVSRTFTNFKTGRLIRLHAGDLVELLDLGRLRAIASGMGV